MLSPISIFIYWLMEISRPYGKSPEAIHRGLPNRKEKRETEKVKLELPVQNGEELGLKLPVCGAICGVLHQILLPQVNF